MRCSGIVRLAHASGSTPHNQLNSPDRFGPSSCWNRPAHLRAAGLWPCWAGASRIWLIVTDPAEQGKWPRLVSRGQEAAIRSVHVAFCLSRTAPTLLLGRTQNSNGG